MLTNQSGTFFFIFLGSLFFSWCLKFFLECFAAWYVLRKIVRASSLVCFWSSAYRFRGFFWFFYLLWGIL